MNSNIIEIMNRKPKRLGMKDVFIISTKGISKPMDKDQSLAKKTVAQLKKMAKAKGIEGYAKMRKTGLIDVLGVDNKKEFAVGKKGDARVGKKKGKALSYDAKKKGKK